MAKKKTTKAERARHRWEEAVHARRDAELQQASFARPLPRRRALGRPPMAKKTVTLSLRLPADLVDDLDAFAATFSETTGRAVTRNEAVRRAVWLGIRLRSFLVDDLELVVGVPQRDVVGVTPKEQAW